MLSESEDLIDAAYSSAYKAATFKGNYNPETRKAYADEAIQLFGKGQENQGNGVKVTRPSLRSLNGLL